jgi:hypothetical protein
MHAENASPGLLALASLATVALGVGIIQAMIRVLASPGPERSRAGLAAPERAPARA